MLERGCGAEDQYFLVAAVQLALELGERLPRSWYPLAIQRWSMLQIQPGFRDESRRLRKALRVWQARRPADVDGQTPLPRDVIESLVARFWWPKQAWVAPQES
jgi:hypothetical protein